MDPTHHDLKQALKDLHQWVLDHPGSRIIPADEGGMLGFNAYTDPLETEQSLSVRIAVRDAKVSLLHQPDSRLTRNLNTLAKTTHGRRFLCSLLSTPNGWHQLVSGDVSGVDLGMEPEAKPFEPRARYYRALDTLILVKEDCQYVAQYIDDFLTFLWHPQDDKLMVGVQLGNAGFLIQRLRAILEFKDEDSVSLTKLVEVAMIGGVVDASPDSEEMDASVECYDDAREFVQGAELKPEEWRRALTSR